MHAPDVRLLLFSIQNRVELIGKHYVAEAAILGGFLDQLSQARFGRADKR